MRAGRAPISIYMKSQILRTRGGADGLRARPQIGHWESPVASTSGRNVALKGELARGFGGIWGKGRRLRVDCKEASRALKLRLVWVTAVRASG